VSDVAEIARGLTAAAHRAVIDFALWPKGCWQTAADVDEPGVVLNSLASKGCLERRTDPHVWGRGQYRVLPLGLAVRAHLSKEPDSE
jgi:hypothetical protein